MVSDAFDLKLVDDIVYEVDCQMVQVKKGADVDIGANASAEEASEEVEDGVETVNNIVHSFRLNQTSFDKKSFLTYLKGKIIGKTLPTVIDNRDKQFTDTLCTLIGYMKTVKTHLQTTGASPEEVTAFEKGAQTFAKKIVANFKDYDFLTGESMNPDGM